MDRRLFISTLAASSFAVSADSATIGDDGLHKQDWFLDSFLEMSSDLSQAADDGKNLLVLFEQRGCPYCRELHEVNFTRKEITDFIKEHYLVVQLDMFGAREVLDFDGETLEEREVASKWAVNFTPTTLIFPAEHVAAKNVEEAEAFRMPGYLKPFHYLSSLEYVANGIYKQKTFQRYLQEKFAELEAKGIKPDVW